MKKTRGLLPFCLLALALALGLVLFPRLGQQETPASSGTLPTPRSAPTGPPDRLRQAIPKFS